MNKTEFSLDTSSFADSANAAERLANTLEDAIAAANRAMGTLYDDWVGKGRNEFEKKYKVFERQVSDIKNGLWDLQEDIVTAETAYIEADLELAKQQSGVSFDYSF